MSTCSYIKWRYLWSWIELMVINTRQLYHPQKMPSFFSYIPVLMLSRIVHVACIGQYFRIIKDDGFESTEQPILRSDAFDCCRQQSCTTIVRAKQFMQRNDDSSTVYFAIKKIHGLFCFDIYFDYLMQLLALGEILNGI